LQIGLVEALSRPSASVLEVRVQPSSASETQQAVLSLCETALSKSSS
jgi:hypothetical protein